MVGEGAGKIHVLEGVLARVLLYPPHSFRKKLPSQQPCQHVLQHPEFPQRSSQPLPSHFLGFPVSLFCGRPHTLLFREEKRNPNPNFLARISSGGVGVFHVKGWGPKSSVCPSKPRETKLFGGMPRDFAWDFPGGARKVWDKKFVFNSRPLVVLWHDRASVHPVLACYQLPTWCLLRMYGSLRLNCSTLLDQPRILGSIGIAQCTAPHHFAPVFFFPSSRPLHSRERPSPQPPAKRAVLTKTAKMMNLHSTHWKQGLRNSDPRKRRKWRKWQLSRRQRHGLEKPGLFFPDFLGLHVAAPKSINNKKLQWESQVQIFGTLISIFNMDRRYVRRVTLKELISV